jgi:hypothetical protein
VPYRYSQTDHGGFAGVEMGQVKNGKIVLSGTPMITDPSPTGAITAYTGTQPAPPASGIPAP